MGARTKSKKVKMESSEDFLANDAHAVLAVLEDNSGHAEANSRRRLALRAVLSVVEYPGHNGDVPR